MGLFGQWTGFGNDKLPPGTSKIYAEMKRELQTLIGLVEAGRLNEADAIWCPGCQKFHPRLQARR